MMKLNINMVTSQAEFDAVIAGRDEKIVEISHALRSLLADIMPGITEVSWPKMKIAGYGVGPKKMSEHFCYIAPFTKHVNLGFIYGADLHDPDGLMEGTGQALRHIKIKSLDQTTNPAIKALIDQASKHLPKLA